MRQFSVPNFYGAHGYDPQLRNMSAIFFAAGPDIRSGSLTHVHNIDVAPTVAQILGVKLFTVQGRALCEALFTCAEESASGEYSTPCQGCTQQRSRTCSRLALGKPTIGLRRRSQASLRALIISSVSMRCT